MYRLQHDDAIREAEQAIQLGGPNYADGYAVLALRLTYGGSRRERFPSMEKALGLDPQAPASYSDLGQAYYVRGQVEKYQKGESQKAQEYYQEAEDSPEKSHGHEPQS